MPPAGLHVFFSTAYQVYLRALLTPADLVEGNAKLSGSEAAAELAGPSLAGLIAQAVGAAAALPPGMLGRVSATMRFLTAGTSPLGALLGGALAAVISPRGALWVLFAMITAAGLLLLSHSFTRRRDLPAAAAPADAPGSAGAVRT